MDVKSTVMKLIAEQCSGDGPRELKPTDRLIEDLGLESLDFVEIAVGVEDTFGLDINQRDWTRQATVESVIRDVQSRIDNRDQERKTA